MSAGAGSIELTARRSGSRTVLERIRYDGISRCSRSFARDDAALVVLSQLGPGVVRGDHVTLTGRLLDESHLIVTSQTATRLMGGARGSDARVWWTLESGASLELIGEPLIATGAATYEASTTIELGQRSRVVLSEITRVPAQARVTLRTSVRQSGRELFYDAVNAAAAAPAVVGTFAIVGIATGAVAEIASALDIAAAAHSGVRIGVGLLPNGVFGRALSDDVWTVRAALIALHAAARPLLFD